MSQIKPPRQPPPWWRRLRWWWRPGSGWRYLRERGTEAGTDAGWGNSLERSYLAVGGCMPMEERRERERPDKGIDPAGLLRRAGWGCAWTRLNQRGREGEEDGLIRGRSRKLWLIRGRSRRLEKIGNRWWRLIHDLMLVCSGTRRTHAVFLLLQCGVMCWGRQSVFFSLICLFYIVDIRHLRCQQCRYVMMHIPMCICRYQPCMNHGQYIN